MVRTVTVGLLVRSEASRGQEQVVDLLREELSLVQGEPETVRRTCYSTRSCPRCGTAMDARGAAPGRIWHCPTCGREQR